MSRPLLAGQKLASAAMILPGNQDARAGHLRRRAGHARAIAIERGAIRKINAPLLYFPFMVSRGASAGKQFSRPIPSPHINHE